MLLLVISVFVMPEFIRIKDIECSSQFFVCNKEVEEELSQALGLPQYKLRKKLNNILVRDPKIQEFSLEYIPLRKVRVNVIENKVSVALAYKDREEYELLSEDGKIIAKVKDSQAPKILVLGEVNKDKIDFSSKILRTLYRAYNIKLGFLYDDRFEVEYESYKYIFPLEGDHEVLLGSFRFLLSWLNSEAQNSKISDLGYKNLKEVDLRFNNPVVK
jgi:hypothetical protein